MTDSTGHRLRSLRIAAGHSVEQLALLAGVSRQAVHAIEQGKRQPSLDTARKLCRALGISLSAFDDPPHIPPI